LIRATPLIVLPIERGRDAEQFVDAFKPIASPVSVHQYLQSCAAVVAMCDARGVPLLPREGIAPVGVFGGDAYARGRSPMAVTHTHTERSFHSSATLALISERTPLFGFMEPGYDPAAIMAARVFEVVTVGLLGSFLIVRRFGKGSFARW
jgi:hypothetical protein